MIAHASQNFLEKRNKSDVEDGLGELEVAKVSRALCAVARAGFAFEVLLRRSHAKIQETAVLGHSVFVSHWLQDLSDRHRTDFIGTQNSELDAVHFANLRRGELKRGVDASHG